MINNNNHSVLFSLRFFVCVCVCVCVFIRYIDRRLYLENTYKKKIYMSYCIPAIAQEPWYLSFIDVLCESGRVASRGKRNKKLYQE